MKKTERITVRLSEEDLKLLKNLSKENRISIGTIVRNAIKEFIYNFTAFYTKTK